MPAKRYRWLAGGAECLRLRNYCAGVVVGTVGTSFGFHARSAFESGGFGPTRGSCLLLVHFRALAATFEISEEIYLFRLVFTLASGFIIPLRLHLRLFML